MLLGNGCGLMSCSLNNLVTVAADCICAIGTLSANRGYNISEEVVEQTIRFASINNLPHRPFNFFAEVERLDPE
jgi:hypothetical protein